MNCARVKRPDAGTTSMPLTARNISSKRLKTPAASRSGSARRSLKRISGGCTPRSSSAIIRACSAKNQASRSRTSPLRAAASTARRS